MAAILYEITGVMYYINLQKEIKEKLCKCGPNIVLAYTAEEALEVVRQKDAEILADDTIIEYSVDSRCKENFAKYLKCQCNWTDIMAKAQAALIGNVPARVRHGYPYS